MNYSNHQKLAHALTEVEDELLKRLVPFWAQRAPDAKYGGYGTCFDRYGRSHGTTDKYIVTQTRMIWFFSACQRAGLRSHNFKALARDGATFLMDHFWDGRLGGWYWRTARNGRPKDRGKVVYGQSFAIYALSEYALATRDRRAAELAVRTFNELQVHAADVRHGGYLENFTEDWRPETTGKAGGDRKSLDVHMHLLEAFTRLVELTREENHRRRLEEVIGLILERLVDSVFHCGRNHVTPAWEPIPAIPLARTWNADRGKAVAAPADTTSYGHNLELVWLLLRAADVLGRPWREFAGQVQPLVDHALCFGLDEEFGGMYRDGPHDGPATVLEKEWWQQSESLVGFLNAYELFGDDRYWRAFDRVRTFVWRHMIAPETGEWYPLCSREGRVIQSEAGHPWKAAYHTGRSMLECRAALQRLLGKSPRIVKA